MTTKASDVKEQSVEQVKAAAVKAADKVAKIEPTTAAKTGKKYIAQWTLHHNNKRYVTGDTVSLSTADAQSLVDAGVLVASK